MKGDRDTRVSSQDFRQPSFHRTQTVEERGTLPSFTRHFISVNEQTSREVACSKVPSTYSDLKYLIESHLELNSKERINSELTIVREKLRVSTCMVYYQFGKQLGNGWRLLTKDYSLPSKQIPESVYISVYTFKFLETTKKIEEEIRKLQKTGDHYREECEKLRIEAELMSEKNKLPRVTFLYGSPLYTSTAKKQHLVHHPVRYLKQLNSLANAVADSKREVRLDVEEFNESSTKMALSSAVLYCIVQSENDHLLGENQFGKLEKVPIGKPCVMEEEQKIELLILQSNIPKTFEGYFAKCANHVVLIHSNVVQEDDVAATYLRELILRVMGGTPVKQSHTEALAEVTKKTDFKNKFLCCCLHNHSNQCPNLKKDEQVTHYSLLTECTCEERFQMESGTNLRNFLQRECCCGRPEQHQLSSKFEYICNSEQAITKFFSFGEMRTERTLRAYQQAEVNCYNLADERQRTMLASFLDYLKSCRNQNRRRIVLNIFGPKGFGKQHMKSMLLNYLIIKRFILKKCEEVTRKIDYAEAQKLSKAGYDLVVLDTTQCDIALEELVELLTSNGTKVIILSEKRVNLNDIKDFQCKELNREDAFLFVLRELGTVGKTQSKRKHLTFREQAILKTHIQKFSGKFTCSFLKRVVDALKATDYSKSVEECLQSYMVDAPTELSSPLLSLLQENQEMFKALLIMSQWYDLSAASAQFLFVQLGIKDVSVQSLSRMQLLDLTAKSDNYSVKSQYQVNLKLAVKHPRMKQFQQELLRLLVAEAIPLLWDCRISEKWKNRQGLIDFSSCSPTSMLSGYLGTLNSGPLLQKFRESRLLKPTLSQQELYKFLQRGFFSTDMQNICKESLGSELTWLAIMVINSLLPLHKQEEATMNVILRNINQLKNLKKDESAWQFEQTILSAIALQLQMQVLLGLLFRAHHDNNKKNISNEDKKVQECYSYLLQVKGVLEEHSKRQPCFKQLVATLKFNIFLMVLARYTKLQLMVHGVSEKEDTSSGKRSRRGSINSLEDVVQAKPATAGKEEETKTLLKLRRQYELVSGDITNQCIKENLKHLKQLVRLLVHGNPHLRSYTTHNIPTSLSQLTVYHQLFQNMLKYQNVLGVVQTIGSSQEHLDSIAQLITAHQKLKECSSELCSEILSQLLKTLMERIKSSIQARLDKKAVLTLLTAYPQNCQCMESKLGVDVEFSLDRLRESIIVEEKALTSRNVTQTFRRGSRFMCLWFEYTSDNEKQLFYDDDDTMNNSQAKEKISHGTVGHIVQMLPKEQDCYRLPTTIFVCGSRELASQLFVRYPSCAVISLSFPPSSTSTNFYLKKLFQQETLQFFVLNLIKRNQGQCQLSYSLSKEVSGYNMLRFCFEIEIFSKQNSLKRTWSSIKPLEPTKLQPKFSLPQSYQSEIASTTSIEEKSESTASQASKWMISPVNVYVYHREDALLNMLRTHCRMGLCCHNGQLLHDFINYLKSICEKKHLYAGGVFVVDWRHYQTGESDTASEPIDFLERQLSRRLPTLTWKPTLLIMEQSHIMFGGATAKTTTFSYLIDFLKNHSKLSILFCRTTKTPDGLLQTSDRCMELEEGEFMKLSSSKERILTDTDFKLTKDRPPTD